MDIAALTALKHLSKKISEEEGDPHSISQVQESNSVFSDVNGNMQGFTQENEQVSENGKLMSKISHQEKQEAEAGGKPHIEELTEIDVPEENIHEQIVNNDVVERAAKVKRDGESSVLNLHSAEKLAGYILETGDETSVVSFLEDLLKKGKISEEEALVFVETIKSYIEEAEKIALQPEDDKIREILIKRNLEEVNEEAAIAQRMEDEEAAETAILQSLANDIPTKNKETESILKINTFLEGALREGEISESLYTHLKEALVESVMEGLDEDSNYHPYGPV